MKCPLKFARYEFEGGEECIGAECGFYGCVCDMDSAVSVQKRPNDELIRELRQYANDVRYDYNPLDDVYEPDERLSELCGQVADMMEHDYVRKDAHSKAQSKTEPKLSEQSELLSDAISENLGLSQDSEIYSREKLEADVSKWCLSHAYGDTGYTFIIKQLDRQAAITANELTNRLDAPKTAETGEISTSEGDIRDFDDSREKLEADVLEAVKKGFITYETLIGWLDRQEAITRRKCDKPNWDYCETCEWPSVAAQPDQEAYDRIAELQAKVDELYKSCDVLRDKKLAAEREKSELTEQLEAAHAKNRALKLHISKMQAGRHGWHVKGVELQRQVDELTAQLHASNAERARLRECLGIATDNAHDFLTLVDESGNVYDRDEGLA